MGKCSGTTRSLKFPWQDRKCERDEQSRMTANSLCYGYNLDILRRYRVLVSDRWHVSTGASSGANFFSCGSCLRDAGQWSKADRQSIH